MNFAGALIAGGTSSRFGQDKASLPYGSGTLAGHLLDEMRAAGLEPLVFNALAPVAGLPREVRVLPDSEPGQGPLGGLATVLRAVQAPLLVAACDMPGLNAEAFTALASAWRPGLAGLVTKSSDGWHPLFGIYGPGLLPEIERRLATGQRALHHLIEDLALEPWAQARPQWLVNVNTLEAWEHWKAAHPC